MLITIVHEMCISGMRETEGETTRSILLKDSGTASLINAKMVIRQFYRYCKLVT